MPDDGYIFSFCPACGRRVRSAKADNPFRCPACGFTIYRNVAAAVCAIVVRKQKLLAAVRKHDPAAGMLDLPGGFVDPGESAEQALARELKEELGLEISDCRYFATCPNEYPCRGLVYRTLDLAFTCTVKGTDNIACADDVVDIRWIDLGRMDPAWFGLESIRYFVTRFAAMMAGK